MQAALAEVFALGVKAGADPLALWAAIRKGSVGRRRTFDGLVDEYLPARFDPPNAALRVIEKDLQLATQLGVALSNDPADRRNLGLLRPDLNPIKMAFSKLKAHLRKAKARTIDDLWKAVGSICHLYTPEEC